MLGGNALFVDCGEAVVLLRIESKSSRERLTILRDCDWGIYLSEFLFLSVARCVHRRVQIVDEDEKSEASFG
jgi:hypothetical protein